MSKPNKIEARKQFDEDWRLGLFDSENKEETWMEYKKLYLKEQKVFTKKHK